MKALGTQRADAAALATLLGKDWRDFIPLGRRGSRRCRRLPRCSYRERHAIESRRRRQVDAGSVGKDAWTFPIPLAKGAAGWRFDTKAGGAEVRARRIGRNELAAVQSALGLPRCTDGLRFGRSRR